MHSIADAGAAPLPKTAEPMTEVTVRLFAAARAAAGTGQTVVVASTLAELIDGLERAHPALEPVLKRCSFLIDEQAAHGQSAEIVLPDGCVVDVLPPFAGG